MKPLRASDIQGTYATLLLPIDSDGAIDFDGIEAQLDYLNASGVDGIYSNGTAGEFYSLSDAEFVRLNERLAQRCDQSAMPFQIGASFPSPQISLERARWAAQLRPGAIQVILPDWYPLTLQEAVVFLELVADAIAPVPLVLYNPPHAKWVLKAKDYAILCERIPSLVGIKVGGGDDAWYESMRPIAERLSIFVPGHMLATGLARGASGSYSNVACLQPVGAKRWNKLMHSDWNAAKRIEEQIQRFLTVHVLPFREQRGFSNMALDKLLACAGGWAPVGTRLRWPYAGIEESQVHRIGMLARTEIPYLFEKTSR